MAKKKVNKKLLKELLDKETFAYNSGNDFGDGKPYSTNQISTKKTSDELTRLTVQPPSNKLPNDFVTNGYLRETKSIAEAILSKLDTEDNELISKDENEKEIKKLKKTIKKIDFKNIDIETKEELLKKIQNG
jgi:hypothetical protein